MSVGKYKGVSYKRQRICDVLAVDIKAKWWFIYGVTGEATGDHYETMREMKHAIDSGDHQFR